MTKRDALNASYAAQAILSAANELLDQAMQAETLDDALELAKTVRLLRERIDAIADRALQRADELTMGDR